MAKTPFSINLDDDLRKSLEREATLEGRPPAELATRAIRSLLQAKALKRAAVEAALDSADQRRSLPSERMNTWIESLDTDEELPPPTAWPFPRKRMSGSP